MDKNNEYLEKNDMGAPGRSALCAIQKAGFNRTISMAPYCSTNSTRRFLAFPSSVRLDAAGL
jgi:hypothetical protein